MCYYEEGLSILFASNSLIKIDNPYNIIYSYKNA